jgi:branched-subunit amino acid aminotransferase/4-amino-4-deoxychorismate lyase
MNDPYAWASPALRTQLLTDAQAYLKDRGLNLPTGMPPAMVPEFVRIASLLWVDGKLTALADFRIDPADEGLLFGRGLWESTRTIGGVPWLWPDHVERLLKSALELKIALTPSQVPTSEDVQRYVQTLSSQDVIVRLNVTAGRPGKPGLVWMSAAVIPYPYTSVRLKTAINPVQKGEAYMALKTFQYAVRLRLGQAANPFGYNSSLVMDAQNNMLEAAHANIFFRRADGWVTPRADGSFLLGTVRNHVLKNAPLSIREEVCPLAMLAQVQEVFVTNSNMGIVPVTQIDDYAFAAGPETQELHRWLEPQAPDTPQYRFIERGITAR